MADKVAYLAHMDRLVIALHVSACLGARRESGKWRMRLVNAHQCKALGLDERSVERDNYMLE
jgi:hypothetical protein